MDELMLLTDGSVNTRSNIGYGAYLAVSELRPSLDLLRARVKVRRCENLLQKEIGMKIYVGNMSYEVTEEDLRLAFEPFGQVESAGGRGGRGRGG